MVEVYHNFLEMIEMDYNILIVMLVMVLMNYIKHQQEVI
jgi:hypothetical protein